MIDDFSGVNFLFAKDAIIRRQDDVGAAELLHHLGVAPLQFPHHFPIDVFISIFSGIYVSHLPRNY